MQLVLLIIWLTWIFFDGVAPAGVADGEVEMHGASR